MATNKVVLILIALTFSAAVHATGIDTKKDVPALFTEMGRFCDVPPDLLYSIALCESGRNVNGKVKPWNWTLNIAGKGYYYDSREEQFDALMNAISEAKTVDIGPMQLNWEWKYERLMSPWMATDPVFNLNTACRIIRAHYENNPLDGWFQAAGKYHREANRPEDIKIRKAYISRIKRAWEML